MPELQIGHVDASMFNFDETFLQFNVKKQIYKKSYSRFDFKCRLNTAS